MAETFDPFDPKNLELSPELAATLTKTAEESGKRKPTKKRSEKRFTKVPGLWEETLAKARASGATYAVAIVLLYEAWRVVSGGHEPVVKLTNVMLAGRRVGRKGKKAALAKLRELGLVAVEERGRKSPLVTVRHLG